MNTTQNTTNNTFEMVTEVLDKPFSEYDLEDLHTLLCMAKFTRTQLKKYHSESKALQEAGDDYLKDLLDLHRELYDREFRSTSGYKRKEVK
tara:strand:- start:364 stop:636 length:273 start_codon:yes stop_codon:yes gene_type:complete